VDDRRETVSLIGSDKVEGTAVYGADGTKIGTVQRVMIDKVSGQIAYAVVSFGGFLGMGEGITQCLGPSSTTTPTWAAIALT
jgi:sporulation protein YlmC with PRC-barrel domain